MVNTYFAVALLLLLPLYSISAQKKNEIFINRILVHAGCTMRVSMDRHRTAPITFNHPMGYTVMCSTDRETISYKGAYAWSLSTKSSVQWAYSRPLQISLQISGVIWTRLPEALDGGMALSDVFHSGTLTLLPASSHH